MRSIYSPHAPEPVGPYSQAVEHNGVLYCSGQVALDPATGRLVDSDIEAETGQVLRNVDAVLAAAGTSKRNVIKCSVFVMDMGMFDRINAVYQAYFGLDEAPARELVQVARLPKGANIEITVIAAIPAA